jgi:hypothetical protein
MSPAVAIAAGAYKRRLAVQNRVLTRSVDAVGAEPLAELSAPAREARKHRMKRRRRIAS